MQLPAVMKDADTMSVSVPPTRSDVLHACDIMEDVAIAFGYDNIKKTVPKTVTIGKQHPINKLTDLLRLEFASIGFTEVLTLGLCSVMENFDFLRRKNDPPIAVEIANPKTIGFEICRTSLLPGLFKTVQSRCAPVLPSLPRYRAVAARRTRKSNARCAHHLPNVMATIS
jgi:phenylalanyl-tRNA synthetase beta chain